DWRTCLVRDVGDKRLYSGLFSFHRFLCMGGATQDPGQLSLQSRHFCLIKTFLSKASGNGAIQHDVQLPEGAPPPEPLPQTKSSARNSQGRQRPEKAVHRSTSQV